MKTKRYHRYSPKRRLCAASIKTNAALALSGLVLMFSAGVNAEPDPAALQGDFQSVAARAYRAQTQTPCPERPATQFDAPDQPLSGAQIGCLLLALEAIESPNELHDPQAWAQALLAHGLSQPLQDFLGQPALHNQQRITSQLRFNLARHAFETGDWQEAEQQLQNLGARYALTDEQRQFLVLMRALKQQQQGEHRQAIKLYEDFEPEHPYYAQARTNLAIAYLKQGWWTDAHNELEQLLATDGENAPLEPEYYNRLRMLLGLSQLQQGYYRYARDSFRGITQGSRYTPHAWRGIGLAALYQEDYPGALNAFLTLQEQDADDLPEGSFLVAFTYDQMNQLTLAQATYTQAMLEYEARLQALRHQRERIEREDWLPDTPPPTAGELSVRLTEPDRLAESQLQRQYHQLQQLATQLSAASGTEALRADIARLQVRYREHLGAAYRVRLEQQQAHMESYLSQSQYGLATIYDRQ